LVCEDFSSLVHWDPNLANGLIKDL